MIFTLLSVLSRKVTNFYNQHRNIRLIICGIFSIIHTIILAVCSANAGGTRMAPAGCRFFRPSTELSDAFSVKII